MKTQIFSSAVKQRAFTLIEILGVLAIVSVLAGVLVPRVFGAISSARVNATVQSVDSLRGAVYDYFRDEGAFLETADASGPHVDEVLLTAGYLDSLFRLPVFAASETNAVRSVAAAPGSTFTAGDNFDISGSGTSNTAGSDAIVRIELKDVPISVARELSARIDGETLSSSGDTADTAGRVVYAAPAVDATTATVFIYIAHF